MIRHLALVAASATLLAVSGCGPLVQIGGGGKPPTALMTLSAMTPPAAGAPADGAPQIGVAVPVVPGPLQTLRVPVTTSDNSVQYLAGATWADQPNREFQRLLADTLQAKGAAVVSLRTSPAPARTLTGQLVDFGLDVRNPGQPVVRVRYDAELLSRSGGAPRLRRFVASEPVAGQTGPEVAAAQNRAATRVAGDVAGWVAP